MASKNSLWITISIFLFLELFLFSNINGQNVKGGYWFQDSGLDINNIDSTLFTHLFCAFAELNSSSNQLVVSPANQDSFRRFTSTVQQKNPSVKTLLSIGGGRANKASYAAMVSRSGSRASFINSSISLARRFGFHGLDLDWEYPASATEMANYGTLLKEWRSAINTEARNTGRTALLLTAAVSYRPVVDGLNYPVQSVATNFDWINIMAYDFYGPLWSPNNANAHAELYDPVNQISGSDGVRAWIGAGVPARKLVLGLPFYGYAWRLVNPNNHGLGAPANGIGDAGSPDDGSMTYSEIRDFIAQKAATTVYNATVVANYCYVGNNWISYDDNQSVTTKVSYAKNQGLLGYFAWQIAGDSSWVLSRAAAQTWGSSSSRIDSAR